ncbi:MAG: RNA-binding cell elongation regulator Jag/EloR [Acidimicrobiales bacterium]
MMDWVETTGRTVDEAKKLALYQLGVAEPDAEFEVVAEAKIGLFGRLKEEARVRARVQPRYPRSKGERRDRRHGRATAPTQAGPAQAPAPGAAGTQPEAAGGGAKRPIGGEGHPKEGTPPRARRRRRAGPGGATDKPGPPRTSFDDVKTASTDEQAHLAEEFLRGLVNEMGVSATISSTELTEDILEVRLTGEDLGTLIGPRGTTLLALQELTRIVLQHNSAPSDCRVVVDINGYRKRRQEALARFAQQVANEVRASNTKRALEPMPPADRKVVHDAVNAIAGVTTISEGEEPHRRVVLVPVADTEPTAHPDLVEAQSETLT